MVHVVAPSPGRNTDTTVCRAAIITELAHPGRDDGSETDVILTVFAPGGISTLTAPHDEVTMAVSSWHWPEIV